MRNERQFEVEAHELELKRLLREEETASKAANQVGQRVIQRAGWRTSPLFIRLQRMSVIAPVMGCFRRD